MADTNAIVLTINFISDSNNGNLLGGAFLPAECIELATN